MSRSEEEAFCRKIREFIECENFSILLQSYVNHDQGTAWCRILREKIVTIAQEYSSECDHIDNETKLALTQKAYDQINGNDQIDGYETGGDDSDLDSDTEGEIGGDDEAGSPRRKRGGRPMNDNSGKKTGDTSMLVSDSDNDDSDDDDDLCIEDDFDPVDGMDTPRRNDEDRNNDGPWQTPQPQGEERSGKKEQNSEDSAVIANSSSASQDQIRLSNEHNHNEVQLLLSARQEQQVLQSGAEVCAETNLAGVVICGFLEGRLDAVGGMFRRGQLDPDAMLTQMSNDLDLFDTNQDMHETVLAKKKKHGSRINLRTGGLGAAMKNAAEATNSPLTEVDNDVLEAGIRAWKEVKKAGRIKTKYRQSATNALDTFTAVGWPRRNFHHLQLHLVSALVALQLKRPRDIIPAHEVEDVKVVKGVFERLCPDEDWSQCNDSLVFINAISSYLWSDEFDGDVLDDAELCALDALQIMCGWLVTDDKLWNQVDRNRLGTGDAIIRHFSIPGDEGIDNRWDALNAFKHVVSARQLGKVIAAHEAFAEEESFQSTILRCSVDLMRNKCEGILQLSFFEKGVDSCSLVDNLTEVYAYSRKRRSEFRGDFLILFDLGASDDDFERKVSLINPIANDSTMSNAEMAAEAEESEGSETTGLTQLNDENEEPAQAPMGAMPMNGTAGGTVPNNFGGRQQVPMAASNLDTNSMMQQYPLNPMGSDPMGTDPMKMMQMQMSYMQMQMQMYMQQQQQQK